MTTESTNCHYIIGDIDQKIYDRLIGESSLAIDCETTGLNPDRDELCVVTISSNPLDKGADAFVIQVSEKPEILKSLLNDFEGFWIAHNAKFDIEMIRKNLGVTIDEYICTRLMSKVARTFTSSHSLKNVLEFFGVQIDKEKQQSYWKKQLTKEQIEYCFSDVAYLHYLVKNLMGMIVEQGREVDFTNAMDMYKTVVKLSRRGWATEDLINY